jgi:diacylglycerol kinase
VPLQVKLVATFRNAGRGVGFMFEELSIRFLAAATMGTIALGAWLSITPLEWCAILLALGLVWAAEGLNTALERLTDLVSPGYHPLAGKAKDLAAGAVLLASVGAFLVGLIVFLTHLV